MDSCASATACTELVSAATVSRLPRNVSSAALTSGVRRQRTHPVDHRGHFRIGHLATDSLGEHQQRRVLRGAEVDVRPGETADEGQLEHLGEPLLPQTGRTQQLLERSVEGAQVEQRLVDVEGNDGGHGASFPRQ